ncbi:ferric reductase-like transmembrane domain-containing protein [Tropicibacter sp. S64]|uniref:ferric reductase-like transmembrane domain-containing protein n=1 Tax=Tropicibacter sp. S64 TaxID=3415122 RepID=UPI003C7EA0B5
MRLRPALMWLLLAGALMVPLGVALTSPWLAYRSGIYIAAGVAGVVALWLLLVQPALVGGQLPVDPRAARVWHRRVGALLITLVVLHIAGLWITSPPDVIDVLLFRSPTPFSLWGALAMWAIFAAGALALVRRRLRPRSWRLAHSGLALSIALFSILHAVLIEGTMGAVTKALLCVLILAALARAFAERKVWRLLKPRERV